MITSVLRDRFWSRLWCGRHYILLSTENTGTEGVKLDNIHNSQYTLRGGGGGMGGVVGGRKSMFTWVMIFLYFPPTRPRKSAEQHSGSPSSFQGRGGRREEKHIKPFVVPTRHHTAHKDGDLQQRINVVVVTGNDSVSLSCPPDGFECLKCINYVTLDQQLNGVFVF